MTAEGRQAKSQAQEPVVNIFNIFHTVARRPVAWLLSKLGKIADPSSRGHLYEIAARSPNSGSELFQSRQYRRLPDCGLEAGTRRCRHASNPSGRRMLLHAVAATQHYAEPQQGTAKESEASRLRNLRTGGGYVENNAVSADSVEIASRAEREGGNAIHKALSDGCSAQTSRTEGHAGNHFAIGRGEGAKIERERATRSVASKKAKIDVIQRRRHR